MARKKNILSDMLLCVRRRTKSSAIVALLLAGICEHLASAATNSSYVTRIWQTSDGLPMNNVTAIQQTRDGYLWVGTRTGLARFDGVRFTTLGGDDSENTGSPHVTSLFEAPDGALWIGHEDGAVTRYRNGKFETITLNAAWSGGKIFSIQADRAGDVWLVNQSGELLRARDGVMIPAPVTNATHLLSVAANTNGFWIQRGNQVLLVENGKAAPLPRPGGSSSYVQGIGSGRNGALWIISSGRIRKWEKGQLMGIGPAACGESPVSVLVETRQGRLVVGTSDHGVFVVVPGGTVSEFSRSTGFSSDWITALCEDREGNIWVGTGNGGLAMLRTSNVTNVNPPDQWQGRAVLSVATAADGAMWVGTEGAGLYSYRNGAWKNFQKNEGLMNYYVWSVVADPSGAIWAGTWGGSLFKGSASFSLPEGWENFSSPTPAMLLSRSCGLLVGTSIGLAQYQSNRLTWLARKPEFVSPDVRAISEDSDGSLWFGMSGGGVGHLKDGLARQLLRKDGLASDYVQCLRVETNGALWIGTFNGLNRFQGNRFSRVTARQGLPSDVICDIADDGMGNFWISSHGGITRVSKTELNRCADDPNARLQCLTYGLTDGLPSLECSGGFQPASCRTADGRLWFPTSKGLVAIDPLNIQSNPLPPPVVIEGLLVDDKPVIENSIGSAALKIPPGRHRFVFQFTGLSFSSPEKVRFKYRLENLDPEWVEVQSPRRAYYSHIPPGEYCFHVQACNNDGVWNETGASLAISVIPAFWQTWWFRLLGGVMTALAGGGIVWLEARRRMHHKLERIERERAVEQERARIAKDIHDDLGARLTRISLLADSVPVEHVSARAAEALGGIFSTAREITEAMDEIVWAVNPQHDTLDSLSLYVGKFAQEFLEGVGVRCRLDIPLELPNWRVDAETRHNLFLAFKECLNNVLRHANATEVHVVLSTSAQEFTLIIRDNGKGFDVAARKDSGGNGLANMRHRLAQIGGRCVVNITPGAGTEVEFFVPLRDS